MHVRHNFKFRDVEFVRRRSGARHTRKEIINEFPVLAERDRHLRLNHTSLMKAVMLHCDIPDSLHDDVYSIISKVSSLLTPLRVP